MKKKEHPQWNPACCTGCVADFTCIVPATQPTARIEPDGNARNARLPHQPGKEHGSEFAGLLRGRMEKLSQEAASAGDESCPTPPGGNPGSTQVVKPALPTASSIKGSETLSGLVELEPDSGWEESAAIDAAALWMPAFVPVEAESNVRIFGAIDFDLQGRKSREHQSPELTAASGGGASLQFGMETATSAVNDALDPVAASPRTGACSLFDPAAAGMILTTATPDSPSSDAGRTRVAAAGFQTGAAWRGEVGVEPGQLHQGISGRLSMADRVVFGDQMPANDPAVVVGTLKQTGPAIAIRRAVQTADSRANAASISGNEPETVASSENAMRADGTAWPRAGEEPTDGTAALGALPDSAGEGAAQAARMRPAPSIPQRGLPQPGAEVASTPPGVDDGQSRPATRPGPGKDSEQQSSGREREQSAPPSAENGFGAAAARDAQPAEPGLTAVSPFRHVTARGSQYGSEGKQPESQSPASGFATQTQPAEQPHPPASLRELNLRVDSGGGRHVDMQFVESGGAVNLKLRTLDPWMADSLRGGIPQLEADLGARGWRAELKPSAGSGLAATDSESANSNGKTGTLSTRGAGAFDGSAQGQPGAGSEAGSERRRQAWAGDEEELMELAALRRLSIKGGQR